MIKNTTAGTKEPTEVTEGESDKAVDPLLITQNSVFSVVNLDSKSEHFKEDTWKE